jgi:hypothetical protein
VLTAKYHQSIILSCCSTIMHVSGACYTDGLVYPFVLRVADTRHMHTFMKYAVDMGSGAMIYVPNFMKSGSGFQNSLYRHTQTARLSHKSTLFFSLQNKKSRLTKRVSANRNGNKRTQRRPVRTPYALLWGAFSARFCFFF